MKISKILGFEFHSMSEEEALELFISHLDGQPARDGSASSGSPGSSGSVNSCKIVVTPNPEAVMRARKDAAFAAALKGADYRLPDGTGVVLASRLTRTPIHNRLRGFDTAMKLFEVLNGRNRKTAVYFLGGAPGIAEKAAGEMTEKYPALEAAGFHDGYFSDENEILITEELKRLKPEILIIGMGMPRQELFALRNKGLPVKLMFCLGGSIDIMSGSLKLSPPLFRKLGLEWLHRLVRQPSRAVRMLALPKFALLVLWRFIMPGKSVEEGNSG